MADIPAIEGLLKELEAMKGVEEAVLVSRSGIHIAGRVPAHVHPETFVAMFAILLGAAETAISELKENLQGVVIDMEESRVAVINDGPKALFVLRMTKDADPEMVRRGVAALSPKMEGLL